MQNARRHNNKRFRMMMAPLLPARAGHLLRLPRQSPAAGDVPGREGLEKDRHAILFGLGQTVALGWRDRAGGTVWDS